jgi:HK97 family phage major capsid protein
MTNLTTNSASILKAADVHDLIIKPLTQEAVAFQVSTVIRTDSNQYRVPRVTGDPDTSWTPEGAEITADDVDLDEIVVTPKKVAGLTVVSNELLADAAEDAAALISARLVNSLKRKIDAAYFSASTTNGPAGLPSVVGQMYTGFTGTAGGFGSNLDWFVDLAGSVEAAGGKLTSWVTPPQYAATLAKVKEATGSNKGLLQPDPGQPTRRLVGGVPVIVSPDVTTPAIWGIDRRYSWPSCATTPRSRSTPRRSSPAIASRSA